MTFESLFGRSPAATASAPGRVNLIGEHTDYNGGYVLPVATPQRTRVAVARGEDEDTVRVWSAAFSTGAELAMYRIGHEAEGRGWLDYVQGITWALRQQGHPLQAFDLRIESAVPPGGGLSSSAALEMGLLSALRELFGIEVGDVELARIGQRAEHEFVGAPVGIMDQMAAMFAGERQALFLDARALAFERVPLPSGIELIAIDSGVRHHHAAGEYRARRAECEGASALLGVPQLRDLGTADLSRVMRLPDPLGRRARHVITENQRVIETVDAMRAGDLGRMGRLLDESHASMRDDYDVSVPDVDLLVTLARAESEVYGARLTGGGFGGSVIALAAEGTGRSVASRVAREYARRSGRRAAVFLPVPA